MSLLEDGGILTDYFPFSKQMRETSENGKFGGNGRE
jgi:hypothetical protein